MNDERDIGEYYNGYVDGWNAALNKVNELFEPIKKEYEKLSH